MLEFSKDISVELRVLFLFALKIHQEIVAERYRVKIYRILVPTLFLIIKFIKSFFFKF